MADKKEKKSPASRQHGRRRRALTEPPGELGVVDLAVAVAVEHGREVAELLLG